jgi:porphobilinogen synthase
MIQRPRRLRRTDAIRSLVRETRLAPENFVLPLFVCPGTGVRREITSMPGVYNLSIDEVTKEVSAAYDMGVRSIILFGLPESKDELASGAYAEDGIVQRAIRSIRQSSPEMIIMAAVLFADTKFSTTNRSSCSRALH